MKRLLPFLALLASCSWLQQHPAVVLDAEQIAEKASIDAVEDLVIGKDPAKFASDLITDVEKVIESNAQNPQEPSLQPQK